MIDKEIITPYDDLVKICYLLIHAGRDLNQRLLTAEQRILDLERALYEDDHYA